MPTACVKGGEPVGLAADGALLFGPRAPRQPCSSPTAGMLPYSPPWPPWRAVGSGPQGRHLRGASARGCSLGCACAVTPWGWPCSRAGGTLAWLLPPAVLSSPRPGSEAQLCSANYPLAASDRRAAHVNGHGNGSINGALVPVSSFASAASCYLLCSNTQAFPCVKTRSLLCRAKCSFRCSFPPSLIGRDLLY